MPKRIQRQRTKGWRMPESCVNVTRPGIWGNPFLGPDAVGRFHRWLTGEMSLDEIEGIIIERNDCGGRLWIPVSRCVLLEYLPNLRGKDLACWCPPDQPCHADVLLELANR